MIRDSVTEVLFDIMQAGEKRYQAQPENSLPLQLLLIDVEQAFTTAQNLWQSWQAANLTHLSPNKAPMLKRPELLQQQTSTLTYQKLSALLDGQCTLRDLAVQMKRLVSDITPSLLTYIQAGIVELVDIPDLPEPKFSALPATPIQSALLKPVIACIDDSPIICQTLEYIITQAGYQCLAIQDPLRAISTLLSSKPDLIFLDLVMPNVNGYEICTSLRKISAFHDTPIVILSGNIIDRVRARVVGASDCLDKPVNSEAVLKLISKYLSPMLSGGRLGVNS
jgi:chemotaxis family two-component system response regulator PixG